MLSLRQQHRIVMLVLLALTAYSTMLCIENNLSCSYLFMKGKQIDCPENAKCNKNIIKCLNKTYYNGEKCIDYNVSRNTTDLVIKEIKENATITSSLNKFGKDAVMTAMYFRNYYLLEDGQIIKVPLLKVHSKIITIAFCILIWITNISAYIVYYTTGKFVPRWVRKLFI